MASVRISAKDWPGFLSALGNRAQAAVMRGVVSGAARCVPYMVKRTDEAQPASVNGARGAVNTGEFRRRWRSRARPDGSEVRNDAPYSPIIDGGRRPGSKMMPLHEARAWARRRLGLSESEAKKAAFPIARAIARRGLAPRRVMSADEAVDRMAKLVRDEVLRELREELGR